MIPRRAVLTGLTSGLAVACAGRALAAGPRTSSSREAVAILGTGKLGAALGRRLGRAGYPIIYGSRTPDDARISAVVAASGPGAMAVLPVDATRRAGIIVFALPWEAARNLLPTLGDLSGRLLIDPMNAAANLIDGYPFRPEPLQSVAEQLQVAVPDAHVVKAFNAIAATDLADPARSDGPITIPIAGADALAKSRVMRLIADTGLEPVDFGPLITARYIEDLLWFEVACVRNNKRLSELYLRPMRA